MRKMISVLLTGVMLLASFTVMPVSLVEADGHSLTQSEVNDKEYVSDPGTLNEWTRYFTPFSTEYAGAVWTDKSVFTESNIPSEFASMDKEIVELDRNGKVIVENGSIKMTTQENAVEVTVGQDNFLVAMSALASTKQITGYSALPSDTVIILDLSNSMGTAEMNSMVEAANKALAELFELNKHNRVGIAVYATNAYELLPIDSYTTLDSATDSHGNSHPVYIELNNGQIRSARMNQTLSVDFSGITNEEWELITDALEEVEDDRWSDNTDLGVAIQSNLIAYGAVIPSGLNINWTRVARNKENNQSWRNYLTTSRNLSSTAEVSVLLDGEGNTVESSVSTGGGTYIQGGLGVALNMFGEIDDPAIDTGLIQAGTKRIPIVVLMSDGAPTYASPNYTGPTNNNRQFGDGTSNSTTDLQVFPTQLSAAYLKMYMEDKYDREGLFYTLGLGVGNSGEALRVLNPYYNSNNTINNYWNGYASAVTNNAIGNYSNGGRTITKAEDANASAAMRDDYRYYTDEYFSADGAGDLVEAFNKIVETIVIQSKYYPTSIESGNVDMDGYVSFEDELGEFMRVKNIKGMTLGNTVFTGDAFLTALTSEAFGNASNWTAYGDELMKSISERLHIEENEARTLLSAAWRAEGQLKTENFIGWYADAEGKYLGFWDVKNHTPENYPAQAAFLNKSYLFQGELSSEFGTVAGSDMMHIIVQVHEQISTGHQSVIWMIPASLIPLAMYSIDIDTNSLETAEKIELSFEENNPIRLLYEVELNPEINSINLMEKVAAHHNHPVKVGETTVGYAFYSNRWGEGHTLDGIGDTSILDPNEHLATVSHFHPSHANERYYYVEDSIVYTDENGTVYSSTAAPTGSGYYHALRLFRTVGEATGTKDKAEIVTKYIPISENVIGEAVSNGDGTYSIPAGTMYQAVARLAVEKQPNTTGTLPYVDYPVIDLPATDAEHYHVYNFLGNNGRLVMYSAQGIKLSKVIDDPSLSGTFNFTVELAGLNSTAGIQIVDIEGKAIANSKAEVVGNNVVVSLALMNNQTAYIIGIPVGTAYTVTETYHDDFRVKSVTVNGALENELFASDTVDKYTLDEVVFTNAESSHAGNLEISKIVKHPYGSQHAVPSTLEFEVVVDLGTEFAGKTFNAEGSVQNGATLSSVTVDDEGTVTLIMGHDDSVMIYGIPENTVYTVKEINVPSGFRQTTPAAQLTGTILSDQTVYAELVNEYTPASVQLNSGLEVEITKNYSGDTWDNEQFTFVVEQLKDGVWTTVAEAVADHSNQNVKPDLSSVEFSQVGTYSFRIREDSTKNPVADVTYDAGVRHFNVVVSDDDFDGKLEIELVTGYNGVTVTPPSSSSDKYHAATVFNNVYGVTDMTINLKKNLVNDTGVEVPMSSFAFALYDENNNQVASVSPGANGLAFIQQTYTKGLLDGVTADQTTGNKVLTISYVLKEVQGSIPGMNYSKAEYKVDVTLTLTQAGTLSSSTVITPVKDDAGNAVANAQPVQGTVEFKNTYALNPVPAATVVTGTKNHDIGMKDGDFSFEIYQTGYDFVITGNPIGTKGVDVNVEGDTKGTFSFNLPKSIGQAVEEKGFTKAGKYYFVIKEVKPENPNPAVTYDNSVYHVTVSVGLDAAQPTQLKVESVLINKVGGEVGANVPVVFTNQYRILQNATVQLSALKSLTGKSIHKDEFTFKLEAHEDNPSIPMPAETVAKAAETSGTVTFGTIEFTAEGEYKYVIREEIPSDADASNDWEVPYPANAPTGTMKYDPNPEVVVVKVTDNGKGVLSAKVYDASGTREITGNDVVFENVYTPNPVDLEFEAYKTYRKEDGSYLKGTDWPEFDFELYKADSSFHITDSEPLTHDVSLRDLDELSNVKAEDDQETAKFTFKLTYPSAGTHYYVLKEAENNDNPAIKYDTREYHITVVVTDYGDGVLVATKTVKLNNRTLDFAGGDRIQFENLHTTLYADVDIPIKKNLVNETGVVLSYESFSFGLYEDAECTVPYEVNGTPVVVNADTNGDASIHLRFTNADLTVGNTQETIELYLKEIEPDNLEYAIDYDESVYKVTIVLDYQDADSEIADVKVELVSSGALTEVNGDIQFTNEYVLTPVQAAIPGEKVLTGRNPKENEFSFELYEAVVTKDETTGTETWTAGNQIGAAAGNQDLDSDGKFDEFKLEAGTLDKADTYHYIIKEKYGGTVLNGMTYDGSEYHVTLVTMPGDNDDADQLENNLVVGSMTIVKVSNDNGTSVESYESHVVFNNEYVSSTEIHFNIFPGTKSLTGREWKADDVFEFELYEAVNAGTSGELKLSKGALLDTVSIKGSDAVNGTVSFMFDYVDQITSNDDPVHYYIIKEASGSLNGIQYDATEYWIAVSAEDDSNGNLNTTAKVYTAKLKSGGILGLFESYEITEGGTFAFVNQYVPQKDKDYPVPPNTRDNNQIPLYGGIMTISVLLMAILTVLKKKRELASRMH